MMTVERVMARKPQPLKSIGSLLLVGAGKMGFAMLDGWLARGLPPKRVAAIEPQPGKAVRALARRGLTLNPKGKVKAVAAIVIAVKPQTAPEAVPPLAAYLGKHTLVLSIMAGRTLGFLEQSLPGAAIVRAMPNTPAAIGRGISVAVANANVSARQRKLATGLLAAVGKVEWVADEALIDAVTALSGSGPAYVFLLAEAMTQAGIAAGLPADLATRLARETVAGSGELLHRSAFDAATLRQNVTSPGGTTAAALQVLMGPGGFDELLTQAIAAATRRSRELAG
jgi:pyrroline-5-carboxylate reductase